MRISVIFFVFLTTKIFSQVDTLYLNDSLIYLSNGEIIEPGKLPKNTPFANYTFTKINDDKDFLLVNGKFKDGGNVVGFYRRIKLKANDGTFYYSWERDLVWIIIDSNNNLVEQNLYSQGVLLKKPSPIHIKYKE